MAKLEADALVGDDADIVQHQPEVGGFQRAVGGLGAHDLVAWISCWKLREAVFRSWIGLDPSHQIQISLA